VSFAGRAAVKAGDYRTLGDASRAENTPSDSFWFDGWGHDTTLSSREIAARRPRGAFPDFEYSFSRLGRAHRLPAGLMARLSERRPRRPCSPRLRSMRRRRPGR
jgi:hypothetical protein